MASPTSLYQRIESAGSARVGPSTETHAVDGFTVVKGDPAALAAQAGVSLEVYALARMISSENGSEPAPYLLALAESTRNKAKQRRTSVSALLLRSSIRAADGKFSEQAAGKWASTRMDPRARHVEAAKIALHEGSDVFAGVIDFFDPSAQDAGVQGTHKLRKTSEQYIAERGAEGLAWIGPAQGIDPYHLMLFAPAQKREGLVDTSPAFAALNTGRIERRNRNVAVAGGISGGTVLVLVGGAALFFGGGGGS